MATSRTDGSPSTLGAAGATSPEPMSTSPEPMSTSPEPMPASPGPADDAGSASRSGAHVYLGHGAAGSAASMRPHVEGLVRRGIAASAIQLPRRKAEAAVDVYLAQVAGGSPLVIGGHSFGGRVASLLAARGVDLADGRRIAGLVLLSYPLHRPGAPDREVRSAHFPAIDCPVLLLSGESDPFARIDLLREAVTRLPRHELVTYPKLGHGLGPVLDDALDRVARFVRSLA